MMNTLLDLAFVMQCTSLVFFKARVTFLMACKSHTDKHKTHDNKYSHNASSFTSICERLSQYEHVYSVVWGLFSSRRVFRVEVMKHNLQLKWFFISISGYSFTVACLLMTQLTFATFPKHALFFQILIYFTFNTEYMKTSQNYFFMNSLDYSIVNYLVSKVIHK